jgi:DNA-binding CsgD family transcriptional regulator
MQRIGIPRRPSPSPVPAWRRPSGDGPGAGLAYVRQLCCLGLHPDSLIAELLRTLQWAIPSHNNVYVGLGPDLVPRQVITDHIVPDALEAFTTPDSGAMTREMMESDLRWLLRERVMSDPLKVWPGFYGSDLYNLVWRPYDQHHGLQGLVRRNGSPAGLLHLFRPRAAKPFSAGERSLFDRMLPYVEHGLLAEGDPEGAHAPDETSGLFVVDRRGRAVYASEEARALLLLARYPSYPVGGTARLRDLELPPELIRLCLDLRAIGDHRAGEPPSLVQVNPRGRFRFRAHWLDGMGSGSEGMIGVLVSHEEPLAARLLRGARGLPLSPSQLGVCLRLAQGGSQETIARQLEVKTSTVKDHVRKLYDKLGVRHRDDLSALLAGRAGPAPRPSLAP